jgi:DNA invertase Pin-like site-specific DNA recombinase
VATTTNAIGVGRVSKDDRGDRLQSMRVQREKFEAFVAGREGWRALDWIEAPDESGHAPLEERVRGVRPAVEAVRNGRARAIVFGDASRAFRNLEVQWAVVRLVEQYGGEVWDATSGRRLVADNGTDDEWFVSAVEGLVNEKEWRRIRQKSIDGQAKAIEDGRLPVRLIPGLKATVVGHDRNDRPIQGLPITIDPKPAQIIREACRMRDEGAYLTDVRTYLRDRRIVLSHRGLRKLFANTQLVGDVRFGEHHFEAPALIAPDVFRRIRGKVDVRGRKGKSDRLLARLGVLRCATCGSRLVVGSRGGRKRGAGASYRCADQYCEGRVAISAELVEGVVVDAVKEALADVEGRASAEQNVREAAEALERAQADLDAFYEFADVSEPAAARRCVALTEKRDAAQEHLDQLGGLRSAVTINAADDWDRLSLAARRELIRATVAGAVVSPGRGSDRVSVELVGE